MLRRAILSALVVAAAGVVGLGIHAAADPQRALVSWIAAYTFVFSTVVSAIVLTMVLDVTGATWPLTLRPIITGVAGAAPILLVLFLPIVLGASLVYPWAMDPTDAASGEVRAVLAHQRAWNNLPFFTLRSVVYVGAWGLLAIHVRGSRRYAGAGLVVIGLTLTFASYDWLMSLEGGFVSTIFGLYIFAGGLANAIALVVILAWFGRRSGFLPGAIGAGHFHALGRIVLLALMFWAYIAFFQVLLIWIANLPREVGFFLHRTAGPFALLCWVLVFGHFALPFLALLSRSLKRSPTALAAVSSWVLLMGAVDAVWVVFPSMTATLRPLDAAGFLAVSGITFAYGGWRFLANQPLTNDAPQAAASLRYEAP